MSAPRIFLLLKAQPIPAGARWITVHPNGDSAPGQPVLVQPHPTHKGVWSVIGGAGGKLNYLKLRGIKPEGSYKEGLTEKNKARKALAKQQAARDKELGIAQPKAAKKSEIAAQRQQHQREFIQKVAEAAGWKPEQTEFKAEDHAHLSPAAYQAAQKQHHAGLIKKAKEFVEQRRQELLADADQRAQALGSVPLTAPKDRPETLTVQDLDPVKAPDAGLGLSHDYGGRAAEEAGGTEKLKEEVTALREPREPKEGGDKRREMAEQIKRELAELKLPDTPLPDPKELDAAKVLEVLAAEKMLRQQEREARKALAKIDKSEDLKEIQAYNLTVTEPPDDADVIQDLQDLARTEQTVSFLRMAEEAGEGIPPEQALYRHIAAGASNALSAAGLTIAGQSLVDRSAVDVLGIAGAAQVAARRLHATLTPEEIENVKEALDDYHVDHYSHTAREAMDRARVWLDAADKAQGMDLQAEDGDDLALAQDLNRQRVEALAEARKILGTALGEFEMGAALNMAMREGRSNRTFEVSLGKINPASAYVQLRALGLEPGDFQVSAIGGEQIAEITPEGMDRISRPVDRDALQRQRTALDIIEGRQDEKGWLPDGFSARTDLNGVAQPGQAPKLALPFDASGGLEQGIKDYFGGRIADGDNPRDVFADAVSVPWIERNVPESQRDAYQATMDALLPPSKKRRAMAEDTKGLGMEVTESASIEDYRDKLDAWADEFVKARYGEARTPFDRQDIPMDDTATEAMHRALSAHPEGTAAFKKVGDLTDKDQQALRSFYKMHVAKDINRTVADKMRDEIKSLEKSPPPETEYSEMLGTEGTNPDYTAWKTKLDSKKKELERNVLDWRKYVQGMGLIPAYEAMQGMIAGKVAKVFHDTYNTLRPDAPLKLGRQAIKHVDRHGEIMDVEKREKRMKAMAETGAKIRLRDEKGRLLSGGIKEELDARTAHEKAMKEQNFDMFGNPIGGDERMADTDRHSLGHVAEQRLAGLANAIGGQFKAGQPVELRATSMTDRYINQQRSIKLIAANKRVALAQGVGCVHGSTRLKCERTGIEKTFYEWCLGGERPFVKSISLDGETAVCEASPVFIKGHEEMFRVSLADGETITVTAKHKFLSTSGWMELKDLAVGDFVFTDSRRTTHRDFVVASSCAPSPVPAAHQTIDKAETPHCTIALPSVLSRPVSSLASSFVVSEFLRHHPSSPCLQGSSEEPARQAQTEGGRRCRHTAPNYLGYCSADSHLYDEQLHFGQDGGPIFQPSPTDARGYTRYCSRQDAPADEGEHNRLYQRNAPRSKHDSFHLAGYHERGEQSRFSSCNGEPFPRHTQKTTRFQTCSYSHFHRDAGHDLDLSCEDGGPASFCKDQRPEQYSRRSGGLPLFCEPFRQSSDTPQIQTLFSDDHISYWKPINSITSAGSSIVFDIRVPVNDCYFAEGFLNHNSGKTSIGLGAFTHLHAQGKVKRGIFAVPSIVQGQFNAEALRLLDPAKGYKWHASPGASRDERIAALKDPGNHFVVMTHQSLRDDLLHLGAQHEGIDAAALADKLDAMTPAARKAWMGDLLEREGIDAQYLNVDEGHNLLNRQGKQNSHMANVFDALSANVPYYVNATADPVKNSVDEAYDLMAKMNPEKYTDRAAFMRRYGPNTPAAKDALRREMLQHLYPGQIDPGVAAKRTQERVDLSAEQKTAVQGIESAAAKVRLARMRGKVDVENAKKLAPEMFDGADPKEHERIAKEVGRFVGVLKNTATLKTLNTFPNGAKLDRVAQMAKARKGKPGVVFAHNLDAVQQIKDRLEKEGHRVAVLTGADSSKKKDQIKRAFSPEGDIDAEADILVTSDAGATGMNAQRGQWLVQYDVSQTAMTHAQRNGRIHRLGQKNNVELIDLMTDHPTERAARKRLAEKYELREIMTSPYEGLDDTGLAAFLHRRKVQDEQEQGGLF